MNRAPIVFRSRRSRLRRFADDLMYGTTMAGLCFALQLAASEGERLVFGLLIALSAVLGFGIVKAIQKQRAWIALHEDRVVWRDAKGRRHEAPLSALSVIEADPFRWSHRVWFGNYGALEFSSDFERSTELRHRLRNPNRIGSDILPGNETWRSKRRFEAKEHTVTRAALGMVLGFFLLFSGLTSEQSPLTILAILSFSFALHTFLRVWFERIEIDGDTLIVRSCLPGIRRRIPIHSILGASRTNPSLSSGGVIDTDQGEIRIRPDTDGLEALLAEAERLGMARFQREAGTTERSSTA